MKAYAFTVWILDDQYQVVQWHKRLYGSQKESMKWEPYLVLMGNRPNAIKYTGFFQQLPQTLQDYLSECDYEQKKAVLKMLRKMVAGSEIETAVSSLKKRIKNHFKNETLFCRIILLGKSNLFLMEENKKSKNSKWNKKLIYFPISMKYYYL